MARRTSPLPSLLLALGLTASLARASPPAPSASASTDPPASASTDPPASASTGPSASAPPAPIAVPTAARPVCTTDQEHQVRTQRRSVVRVLSGGVHPQVFEGSLGILYPTPRHVVTHRDSLGVGRPLTVTLVDGEEISGHPIGSLPGTDLVLLELEKPAPWPVAELAPDEASVGQMVLTIPLQTSGRMDVRASSVLRHTGQALVIDEKTVTHEGAPLFDCEGRVVALGRRENQYIPTGRIRELVAQPPWPVEAPSLSFLHGTFLMAVQLGEARTWLGAVGGWAVSHRDQIDLRLTLGLLTEMPTRQEELAGKRIHAARLQVEPTLGYRLLLVRETLPTYLIPTVGVVASWDWGADFPRAQLVRPSFGARLQAFPLLALGYTAQPRDLRFREVTHQLTFGVDF